MIFFGVKQYIGECDPLPDDLDPLESVLNIQKYNHNTVRIVSLLFNTFDFPISSEYINEVLSKYDSNNNAYERIFDIILENNRFDIDAKVIALARVKGKLDYLIDYLRKSNMIDTNILYLLERLEPATKQICGTALKGVPIILETDKGMIWGDRIKMKNETVTFYRHDPEYAMLHDGDMNPDFPIYRTEIGGKVFFMNEIQRNTIMNENVITFSSYLDMNVLVVRHGEPPRSIDLVTFIARDKCEMYL